MPGKPTLSQVGPGANWWIRHGVLYVCTHIGSQIEVGVDLEEQVWPTGLIRIISTNYIYTPLYHILCSSLSHGILKIVDITHERIWRNRGQSHHGFLAVGGCTTYGREIQCQIKRRGDMHLPPWQCTNFGGIRCNDLGRNYVREARRFRGSLQILGWWWATFRCSILWLECCQTCIGVIIW